MMHDPRFRERFEELRTFYGKVSTDNASSMQYYKRRWDENRGDEYATWGCAEYFLEAAPDGTVVRQMEIYDGGAVLQYHPDHIEDAYGGLTDQPLDHGEYGPFAITRGEFWTAWDSHLPSTWRIFVDAIKPYSPAVRVKWSGDNAPTPWEAWVIVSSKSYLETGLLGPVPFQQVEWVEIDPTRRNLNGRLAAAESSEWSRSVVTALERSGLSYVFIDDKIRVLAKSPVG